MRRLLCFLVSSTSIISVLSWAAIDLSDTDLPVTSSLGMRLMSKARRLEQNDESYSQVQTKWISGYSIKFLACHHIQQVRQELFMMETSRTM